ncbi:MAG: 16S rRNA (adenine(1518)-N(6)/adenine(1519)-N(6))-dimethyltransferase RsmA [Elusimicrobiota bacterium]
MRTRLGQNFLVDKNIAKKIIRVADISLSDTIIEIGPGKGILTDELINKSGKIIAVEIDKKLVIKLSEKYKNQKNIEIIHSDFLKYNPPNSAIAGQKLKFIANLPYYISSAVISKILQLSNWDTAVFMVQKEVAIRLKAQPNSADYSVLTIACQVFCEVEKMFDVPNTCFCPVPEVTSTVVRLNRLKKPLVKKNEEKNFFRIVKLAFLHRRKTILNSLSLELRIDPALPKDFLRKGGVDKKILEEKILQAGISPQCRAETIPIDGFVKLAKVLT